MDLYGFIWIYIWIFRRTVLAKLVGEVGFYNWEETSWLGRNQLTVEMAGFAKKNGHRMGTLQATDVPLGAPYIAKLVYKLERVFSINSKHFMTGVGTALYQPYRYSQHPSHDPTANIINNRYNRILPRYVAFLEQNYSISIGSSPLKTATFLLKSHC